MSGDESGSLVPKSDAPSPSVDAPELWGISCAEALALVDSQLGSPEDWSASALLRYRLTSSFQADWKAEAGHWLAAARRFGFLKNIQRPIFGERDKPSRMEERDLHDSRHLKWHQRLAEALLCHYFASVPLGWSFEAWEPETGGAIDIDLALRTSDGTLVEFQVKAPDRPAKVVDRGRFGKHDAVCHGQCGNQAQGPFVPCLGNCDKNVIATLAGAVEQLPKPARSVAMVGVFAQRSLSLATHPGCLIRHLYGRTIQCSGRKVYLPQESFGQFMLQHMNHVAGVVIIDILRGVDLVRYPCTVLLNPNATMPAKPEWFPRSRVLVLQDDSFQWLRDAPGIHHWLPTGTRVVEALPE